MASAWTFGRIGRTVATGGDGLELSPHYAIGSRGDEVRIEADLDQPAGSTAIVDQKVLRDQFRGYDLNTDEPIVSVTDTNDSTIDGFYRVNSVEVVDTQGTHFSGGLGSHVTADLVRATGFKQPLLEVVSAGAVRTNGHGATGDPWLAIPTGTITSYVSGDISTIAERSLTSEAGAVRMLALGTGLDYLYDGWVTYEVEAASYYKGPCGIEVTYDNGATWRTLVGRQIPDDSDGWRLTNHLTRVTNVSGDLRVEYYDAGPWEATDFQVGTCSPASGSANFTAHATWQTVTVTRNSLETASLRLSGSAAVAVTSALTETVDLSLRRGALRLEGRFTTPFSTLRPGVYRDASEAGTAITGGIEATAANASGNKYIILSPQAIDKDVTGTSGVNTTATASYIDFGIGVTNEDLIGGGVTAIEEYFAANRIRQQVVAR